MVITSVFWLPVIGVAAYIEMMGYAQTTDAMMSYYRWMIFTDLRFPVQGLPALPPPLKTTKDAAEGRRTH